MSSSSGELSTTLPLQAEHLAAGPGLSKSNEPLRLCENTESMSKSTDVGADEATVSPEELNPTQEVWISLRFSCSGKNFNIKIAESDRVHDLKTSIFSLTNIPPERQKILGLIKGKLPADEETIGSLKLISGKSFNVIGTPVGDELKDPSQLKNLPDVVNDLDVDFSENPELARQYLADRRNQRKIEEATQRLKTSLTLMHPLREGKKLLVLDIDYTILDTKPLLEGSLPPIECARPGLHEFLEAVYPFYDICIWSQTSWIWLETKLHELGMIGSEHIKHYKINFVLDKSSMFQPLQIIWNLFPQFNASNTIHIDDLGRNFALNPKQGLKISAFKEAHTEHAARDHELHELTRYMLYIAVFSDLRDANHKDWKKIVRALRSS